MRRHARLSAVSPWLCQFQSSTVFPVAGSGHTWTPPCRRDKSGIIQHLASQTATAEVSKCWRCTTGTAIHSANYLVWPTRPWRGIAVQPSDREAGCGCWWRGWLVWTGPTNGFVRGAMFSEAPGEMQQVMGMNANSRKWQGRGRPE